MTSLYSPDTLTYMTTRLTLRIVLFTIEIAGIVALYLALRTAHKNK